MNNDLLNAALACIRAGVSIIPIDHTTKRPAANLLPRNDEGKPTWKPYQSVIADEVTVQRWDQAGIGGIAVVGGTVSGGTPGQGLLVLDFDVRRFYDAWLCKVGDLAAGLPVQQTAGGGRRAGQRTGPGGAVLAGDCSVRRGGTAGVPVACAPRRAAGVAGASEPLRIRVAGARQPKERGLLRCHKTASGTGR